MLTMVVRIHTYRAREAAAAAAANIYIDTVTLRLSRSLSISFCHSVALSRFSIWKRVSAALSLSLALYLPQFGFNKNSTAFSFVRLQQSKRERETLWNREKQREGKTWGKNYFYNFFFVQRGKTLYHNIIFPVCSVHVIQLILSIFFFTMLYPNVVSWQIKSMHTVLVFVLFD